MARLSNFGGLQICAMDANLKPKMTRIVARIARRFNLSPQGGQRGVRPPDYGKVVKQNTTSGRKNMKVGVAGQGAFGQKHLEGIAKIPGIEVITLTGGNQTATEEVARKFKIPHWTGDLA
jgi:hypothetical protein